MKGFTEKVTARLNHANICTIHEVDEFDGQFFIAIELFEGQTLRQLSMSNYQLKKIIHYARQIAKGLHKAHGTGIIHRDIKSDNIMVNDEGQVKIMDFGLAKLTGQAGLVD